MKNKVSIVVSNYFNGKYISEAISSIFEQTYNKWEIIVIDDTNGKDNVENYLKHYLSAPYTKLFLFKTDDIGLSALRNLGAKKSKGDYILFLDADDKLHPDFLEKTVKILNDNPNISVAYTDTQHFGGADSCWLQPEYNFNRLLVHNYICSCSLIRRISFDAVGGYDTDNFNYWEDYEFWIALGSFGFYGKHIPEKLFYYRVHSESGMQSQRNIKLSGLYKCYIISKFPHLYRKEDVEKAVSYLNTFPENFMKWKPKQQEEYLVQKGVLGG